jgi:hypothetical protein
VGRRAAQNTRTRRRDMRPVASVEEVPLQY